MPPALGEGLITSVEELALELGGREDLPLLGASLEAALPQLQLGVADVRNGDPCGGATRIATAVAEQPDVVPVNCLALQLAPFQRFHPFGSPPYEILRPEGYDLDGTYQIETGMRFAVVGTCEDADPEAESFPRCSAAASVTYTSGYTGLEVTEVVAPDLARPDPGRCGAERERGASRSRLARGKGTRSATCFFNSLPTGEVILCRVASLQAVHDRNHDRNV
jgi:hypothetical protein